MILQFKVKNFKSIWTEQILSFASESQDSKSKRNFIETPFGNLLKSVAIYGANASGKTNILKAIFVFCEIFIKSALLDKNLPYMPFKFQEKEEPTEFELSFIYAKKLYRYGFAFVENRILEEWLFVTNATTQRESEIFYRCLDGNQYNYKFGRNFRGEKKALQDRTRENSLFLSKCALENHLELRELYLFVLNYLHFLNPSSGIYSNRKSFEEKTIKKQEAFLKNLGIEFDSLRVEKKEITKKDTTNALKLDEQIDYSKREYIPEYFFVRKGKIFSLDEESSGTKALLGISLPLIEILENGGLIIFDEIEKSLHPLIVEQIIKIFHNVKNQKAQILFTTHNTSILKASLFSKDQIYFTEKQDYATELYSLLEFKNVRSDDNYEKKYLAGNYGALPILDEFDILGGDDGK